MVQQTDPLEFFAILKWIDGKPLEIDEYRKKIFREALFTFDDDGNRQYTMALCGRAKKNFKTSDLVLAALYFFLEWKSPQGNDCFILANDEGQANDDLSLVKKLIAANPSLAVLVDVSKKEIVRKDGKGTLSILPAKDVSGAHGKTFIFVGFDEIHAYRSHDLFEALAPDPTRPDVMVWVTSYAGIRHAPGIPLYDFLLAGKAGNDPRMYFSWYGGDYTTDPDFENCEPEVKANPSMASWKNKGYLETQRARLPTHKFRRLHLNLPGAPDGAAFDGDLVVKAIVPGRKRLAYEKRFVYFGFVDMSGGSRDDATLGIAHYDEQAKKSVLDLLECQTGKPPFNTRSTVEKFARLLKEYGLTSVTGDDYGGNTFREDFKGHGITYKNCQPSKADIYDRFEPILNAENVELLDHPKLQEQLLTLVVKAGGKIDHQTGDHDDFANAAAGAIWLTIRKHDGGFVHQGPIIITRSEYLDPTRYPAPYGRDY